MICTELLNLETIYFDTTDRKNEYPGWHQNFNILGIEMNGDGTVNVCT